MIVIVIKLQKILKMTAKVRNKVTAPCRHNLHCTYKNFIQCPLILWWMTSLIPVVLPYKVYLKICCMISLTVLNFPHECWYSFRTFVTIGFIVVVLPLFFFKPDTLSLVNMSLSHHFSNRLKSVNSNRKLPNYIYAHVEDATFLITTDHRWENDVASHPRYLRILQHWREKI